MDPAESHVTTMEHQALVVRNEEKVNVLAEIAARPARTLLFVRTKHGADRLVKQLGRLGVAAQAIHGNRNQGQRQRALDAFSRGESRVLVATDVAARGIHITDVDLVVHVDPPNDHKDYLHRSGRTARAGASGVVVSVLGHDQLRAARHLFGRAGVDVDPGRRRPGQRAGARAGRVGRAGRGHRGTGASRGPRAPAARRRTTTTAVRQHRHRRNGRRPSGRRAA